VSGRWLNKLNGLHELNCGRSIRGYFAEAPERCYFNNGGIYDSKIKSRRVSIVFAKEKPEDEQAKESGDVQIITGGEETRAGSAVF
jgi:hypothetical protein